MIKRRRKKSWSSDRVLSLILLVFILFNFMLTRSLYQITSQILDQTNLKANQNPDELELSNERAIYERLHESPNRNQTSRTFCRELEANGQSCIFEGISCLDTGSSNVFLVNDNFRNNSIVPHDNWCGMRHQTSDPKYFSSRLWPFLTNTTVPQRSCMKATYISWKTFERLKADNEIKYLPSLSLVNLDYTENSHNNHLLKDIIWLLDFSLFQESIKGIQNSLENEETDGLGNKYNNVIPYERIYLPQTSQQFEKQTSADLNRLMYSMVLRKPTRSLYTQMFNNYEDGDAIVSQTLFKAYPELLKQLIFKNEPNKYICTPKLIVGAKIGDGAHERVCRYMRSKAFNLYGIRRPDIIRAGQVRFARPKRSVLIIDRHKTRRIANRIQLLQELSAKLNRINVTLEYMTTQKLKTAQDYVRYYSSAGIILTPHGSHNMGQIFMQRHSALIEIMPVAYTDYAFNLLSQSCKIWHFELQSSVMKRSIKNLTEKCGSKVPHIFSPCTPLKSERVWVNITKVYDIILFALERLGHDTGTWLDERVSQ